MLRNEPNLGSKSKNNEFLARAPPVAEKPVVVENGQQLLSSGAQHCTLVYNNSMMSKVSFLIAKIHFEVSEQCEVD